MPDPRQGVFETLLVLDGRPVELDAHLARLEASLAELFPDRVTPDLSEKITTRAADIELGAIRATVAPAGPIKLEVEVEERAPPGAFMSLSGRKAPVQAVAFCSLVVDGGLGAHKWADRSLLDGVQAGLPADALPLIVDADGTALEASRASLFAVRDGVLSTPPLDGRILPGVTRLRVLELAPEVGIDAQEAEISRAELLTADEVFLTGSVRGVERVGALDGAPLPADGDIAARLGAELRRAWAGAPTAA